MRRKISFYLSKSSEVHSAYCLSVFTRRRSEVSRLIVLVEVGATKVNYSLKTKKPTLGQLLQTKKKMILAIHDVSTSRASAMQCHFNQMGTKLTLVYKKVGEKSTWKLLMIVVERCCWQ